MPTIKTSLNLVFIALSLLFFLHIAILVEILPYHFIWGSRLQNISEMRKMEGISIIVNIIFLLIISMRAGWIQSILSPRILQIGIGLMSILFLFNTIGNIFSTNLIERCFFAPLTLILSFACLRIAILK